jgi:hypothetical protein
MTTYVLRDGKLVEKSAASIDPRLHIISDTMPMTLNHANGQRYDSKRAYEKGVRAAGCEIVGNEKLTNTRHFDPGPVAPDVKAAIEHLRARR